jgi:hypothetical protein
VKARTTEITGNTSSTNKETWVEFYILGCTVMDSLRNKCVWVGISIYNIAPGLAIQNAGVNKMVKTMA